MHMFTAQTADDSELRQQLDVSYQDNVEHPVSEQQQGHKATQDQCKISCGQQDPEPYTCFLQYLTIVCIPLV